MSLLTLPDYGGNWRSKAFVYRTAKTTNGKTFIKPVDLYKTFKSEFIAVGISVSNSRENWRNGGYLAQEIRFVTGTNYANNNKAFYRLPDLLINDVTIIRVGKLAETYRLRYFPPNYFTDVSLKVWEYVGTVNDTNQVTDAELEGKLTDLSITIEAKINSLSDFLATELTKNYLGLTAVGAALEVDVSKAPQDLYVLRLNIGGLNYTDSQGNVWTGQQLPEYEGNYRVHDPIDHPDSYLFESSFNATEAGFSDPTAPDGEYQISFYAQEWYRNDDTVRFIDIYINGVPVETGINIWTEAGGMNKPLIKTYILNIVGGLEVYVTAQNSKYIIACAFEIVQVS